MNEAAKTDFSSGDALGAILASFQRAGFTRCEPKILQPAGVFLDRSGEDFRGRLYLTSDAAGDDVCLRPEYTIPVCLAYLASSTAGAPASFAYGGAVFRFPAEGEAGDGELLQAGLESFGRDDREAADAEILAAALEAASAADGGALHVETGDAGLVSTFLDRLDLPPAWRRRLETGHARGESLTEIFAPPANGKEHAGVLAALEKVDAKEARALVEDLLSIAGISPVGGRSAGEIAERFLDQAALAGGAGVSAETHALVDAFFSVQGQIDEASAALRKLAQDASLDLSAALDSLETRAGFLAARGVDLDRVRFSASFARRLDYYSGFVFEARREPAGPALIGGGRYDRLLKTLGAKQDIPAVGAAIWVDRLTARKGSAA
ncbi:ATP phosphoribosyltransferase regulatory subunit [Methylosinus sporium]|uniref:ATP phosphoribosyltransferase regulatory subunit n=1 Tax=Methylosinus sporium TaxID=428 RepID=A0A549SS26_METSR|nr:ATP phosphoribosyltransferase regulatory subunit [Methylosinus sporium]TRL32436.1 ATP phosphoribosyltransferase regulatory subunit [Methylosinus sporium]